MVFNGATAWSFLLKLLLLPIGDAIVGDTVAGGSIVGEGR